MAISSRSELFHECHRAALWDAGIGWSKLGHVPAVVVEKTPAPEARGDEIRSCDIGYEVAETVHQSTSPNKLLAAPSKPAPYPVRRIEPSL